MGAAVLSESQIEQFIKLGYVRVPQVFSRDVAGAVREFLWEQIELSPDEPQNWIQPVVHLQKCFTSEPFASALTPRFWQVCDELMGKDRWQPIDYLGWWPVSFPGFEKEKWRAPGKGLAR